MNQSVWYLSRNCDLLVRPVKNLVFFSASIQAAQIIAGIYLELSFSPEIRATLASDTHSCE